ncbi:MAG: ATP-dependent DNA helicase RecG, partial [Eubacterium sp.]|nr:ATP-dependent DNA helicase RecG [Eubacterium sp.]
MEEAPNAFPMPSREWEKTALASLPYKLTKAQDRTLQEIRSDLNSKTLMHRLIQGDVGSGKTILAFCAMLTACENGYQSALMAPTEVLAAQHENSFRRLLAAIGKTHISVVLLKGSCTPSEKKRIDTDIAEGRAQIIIGTHALFQKTVRYHSLALVITDEQHRFGVHQREEMIKKGRDPHVLVMSATPIPRTLARILYGDLDISVLDEMPHDRLPVKNCVVGIPSRPAAWKCILKEVLSGHQAFVVCPMIEANEEIDAVNVLDYAVMLEKWMSENGAASFHIGILHGRMKDEEKEVIMDEFQKRRIHILVSTTVIEVGIDIPNATVMLIENAERFGLSQLHQLRGRVGRGDKQAYCIFLQGDGKKETAKRLEILNRSNDGFEIAEEDLKLRGPGDLFGERQSGLLHFRIADIARDAALLRAADEAAGKILAEDPYFEKPENRMLGSQISVFSNAD